MPKLKGKVSIPNNFYKIIIAKDKYGKWKLMGFLIPNAPLKASLKDFLVTINELGDLTKLDFCYELPDQIEEPLEASIADLNFWKFE